MKGLVLAGGHGTRLRPLTYGFAKQLIPVANKPVLFYALENLRDAGISDVVVNVAPHSKDDVMAAVGDGSRFGLRIQYSLQDRPLGIAHAIKLAKPMIGEDPFVVFLGDNILRNGIRSYVRHFQDSDADAVALVSRVEHPERFGTVEVSGNRAVRLVEKPKVPTSDLAMVGVYLLKSSIFSSIERLTPSWRNELEIVDAYQDLINNGNRVEVMEVDGWWADTGTADDLLTVNGLILDDLTSRNLGEVDGGAVLEGPIVIGHGTKVRKDTIIRGPVIIGDSCEVGPDVYVGPHTSIGDNVEIKSTKIENSIVMDGAKIAVGVKVVDSLIGKGATITERKEPPTGMKLILGQQSYLSL
jgi:glucose-1-phosphate thymidylyltransferase